MATANLNVTVKVDADKLRASIDEARATVDDLFGYTLAREALDLIDGTLRELDTYAQNGDECHAGPLATRAGLRRRRDALLAATAERRGYATPGHVLHDLKREIDPTCDDCVGDLDETPRD